MARVLLVDRPELAPGEPATRRFRLEAPVVALPGDRFVVRSYSPIVTIGGGTVLDIAPPRFKRKGPALAAHLALLATGEPPEVLEEHLKQAGVGGRAGCRSPRPDALRPGAAARAPRRAPAGRPRRGGGSRVVSPPRRERSPARPDARPARGLPRREPPARRHLPRGAAQPGRQRPGAGLHPAPDRAGGGRGRQERAGPGAARLPRHPAQPGAGAGGQGTRGRLPRGGRRAPEPGGGPGQAGRQGHGKARALPGPGGGPDAPACEGVAVLSRRGAPDRPGAAGGLPAREEGDRAGRLQGPVRGQPEVRHPADGVLRHPARHRAGRERRVLREGHGRVDNPGAGA